VTDRVVVLLMEALPMLALCWGTMSFLGDFINEFGARKMRHGPRHGGTSDWGGSTSGAQHEGIDFKLQ